MKVFISQPMKDMTDEEILMVREKAVSEIHKKYGEAEIMDSFFQGAPHDAKPLWFLGKSLELLSTADLAWFCPGWSEARGCTMEHNACFHYGIPMAGAAE